MSTVQRPATSSWAVRVHGSTSNLGPGFDFLGLSLGLFLDIQGDFLVGRPPGAHTAHYAGGAPCAPRDDLMLRAIAKYSEAFGRPLPALAIEVSSEIPVGRGFGSSGAAVAAGLLIAATVAGHAEALTDREGLLAPLALELEGHPDNGVASLLGGCTLAVPHGGGLKIVRQPVDPDLGFVVAWPQAPLFTPEARRVLPERVPLEDAIENPRRLALLLHGLRTGDPEAIALGIEDRLHERFRRALIPGADRAVAAAKEAGAYGATLSGAGSGLVAIGPHPRLDQIGAALAGPLDGGRMRIATFEDSAPVVLFME